MPPPHVAMPTFLAVEHSDAHCRAWRLTHFSRWRYGWNPGWGGRPASLLSSESRLLCLMPFAGGCEDPWGGRNAWGWVCVGGVWLWHSMCCGPREGRAPNTTECPKCCFLNCPRSEPDFSGCCMSWEEDQWGTARLFS